MTTDKPDGVRLTDAEREALHESFWGFSDHRRRQLVDLCTATVERILAARASTAQDEAACECPPCLGRGNDGHGLTHCAECCFGTRVEADEACPIHGRAAYAQDEAGEVETLRAQVEALCREWASAATERSTITRWAAASRLRAALDQAKGGES